MLTVRLGNVDALPVRPLRGRAISAPAWAAPGVAAAGAVPVLLTADACGSGYGLPASALALTIAGLAAWLSGVPRERRDRVTLSIAVAITLIGMAALQNLLVCILSRTGMVTADLMGTCGLVLLFVAVAAALDQRRRERAAVAAVAIERRRLARELHDGVAQELAYIRTQSRAVAGGEKLVEAAERALDESRAAISALVRATDEPLARTIEHAALSLGERHQLDVSCDCALDAEADDATRYALLRILREAIGNAARHGGAHAVRVELRAGPCLSVIDDGRGFDPAAGCRPDSLGIVSMRERAEAMGAQFALRSDPGGGTCVRVALS